MDQTLELVQTRSEGQTFFPRHPRSIRDGVSECYSKFTFLPTLSGNFCRNVIVVLMVYVFKQISERVHEYVHIGLTIWWVLRVHIFVGEYTCFDVYVDQNSDLSTVSVNFHVCVCVNRCTYMKEEESVCMWVCSFTYTQRHSHTYVYTHVDIGVSTCPLVWYGKSKTDLLGQKAPRLFPGQTFKEVNYDYYRENGNDSEEETEVEQTSHRVDDVFKFDVIHCMCTDLLYLGTGQRETYRDAEIGRVV